MKQLRWIMHEIKMQWKNGLYILYVLVNLFYILLLGYIPTAFKEMVATVVIISDPTFVGMIFAGGIFLLERNQGIPKAIGISPLGSVGYLLGKIISLVVIALLTSLCLMKAGDISINVISVLNIIVTSSIFTCIGLMVGTYAKSLNHFICLLVIVSIPLALPLITYIFAPHFIGLVWVPTYATIKLLGDLGGNNIILFGYGSYLMLWLIATILLTKKVIEQKVFVS